MKRFVSILLLPILVSLLVPQGVFSRTQDNEFVRTANYFLLSGSNLEKPQNIDILSKHDLIVIPVEAQVYNKPFFKEVRKRNPDIIILPYIATVSWNHLYWNDPLHKKLFSGIQDSYWLTDGNGGKTSVWPNTNALNLNTAWADHLSSFVDTQVLSSGLWDGVFYDEVQDSIRDRKSVV